MTRPKVLYTFFKMIGLCPFAISKNGKFRFSYSGVFYSIALASVSFFCYMKAMKNRLAFIKPRQTTMFLVADILAKSTAFLTAVTTWLIFAFRQNRFRSLQKSFNKFSEACIVFGVCDGPRYLMKNGTILAVICNVAWGSVLVCGHLQHSKSSTYQFLTWLLFNFGRIIYPNLTIIFFIAMSLVKERFRLLNDAIGQLSSVNLGRQAIRKKNGKNRSRIKFLDETDSLSAYIQLRSELVELTTSGVNFLSVPIYFAMAAYILELTSALYVISLNIKYEQFWWEKNGTYFWALNVWQICQIIGLITLLTVADSTGQEVLFF
ncbi:uncharacterized protein [Venturia canescens]|uniref:uncharacterized protein n=1 Tax=Venturia canescens TaxID=32260 RepID=UPI001C9BF201|nr:uncharacterized protein LOC122416599 [Venturia canescens]